MNLTLAEVAAQNHKDILKNGLTVVTVEMPYIHTMELVMFVRAGLRFENEDNNGISHFLEHMMFRGNREYPTSLLLNRKFETLGTDLRASTLSEYTSYGFSPHRTQLKPAMQAFAGFFTYPTFPQIELEREIILEEYLEELNENGENVDIDDQACRLLYRGTPLAMPTVGTEQTIKGITTPMLEEYFRKHYIPKNMVLAVAGPVEHGEFIRLAEKYFSGLTNGGTVVAADHFQNSLVEEQNEPQFLFQHDSDSQIQLQLCFRALSYNHPDYYTLYLLSRIFDDGFSSRLQRALREDRGLVYSVDCRVTCWSDTGTIDFDASVRPEKVQEVARILFQEIRAFIDAGPTEEEVQHVKKRSFYDLDVDRDDPYKQIVRHGFPLLYSYEVSVEEEWAILEKITREDIHRLARSLFVPEKLNLVVVGPHTPEIKQGLEDLARSF